MWLQESKNRIFFDMHFPDWPNRQTSTNFRPKEIADTFAKNHVDSVILYAKCQFGNFYFDTKTGHKHSGLGDLDLFRELSALLRERNIKVIAYYSVSWDELQAKEHPEWMVEGEDGIRGSGGEFRWSTLCINSPYRELVKTHLKEITEALSPDGYWIDMTIIGGGRCYCPYCAKKYEERTGEKLVRGAKAGTKERERFLQFRYDTIEEFYAEIYSLIRSIKPDCMISNNYWGYPYSNSGMGSRAIGALRQCDYITGEAYTDWTGLSAPGFFSKWLRSAAAGRPYEALIGRFTGTWDYTTKPAVQMELEGYTIAANGGTVTLDDEPYADGSIDTELYDDIGKMFETIDQRREYLDGDFLKHTAIFHSLATKDAYFDTSEKFISGIAGAYRLCKELSCPAEFVFDENLTLDGLTRYPVVIMPSVAVLQKEHIEMLQSYLEQGGLIIAAGETGAYELADGELKPSDAFQKLTGLKREGVSDYTVTYYQMEQNEYSSKLPKRPVTVRDRYVKYQGAPEKSVKAWAVDPICENSKTMFFHNNLPAPYETTSYPALIAIPKGKGCLVLFAQDVFAQFARYHQVEIKKLFQNILKAHQKQPAVRFHCSSNVETSVLKQKDRWILHLVNFNPGMTVCAGRMDTFEAKYARTFEFVDQIQELHQVEIEVDFPIKSAFAIESNEKVEVRPTEKGSVLTLGSLKKWETIVLTGEEKMNL